MNSLLDLARKYPDGLAYLDGRQQASYGELLQQVDWRVAELREHGVAQSDRIVWCSGNDLDSLVTFWSLLSMACVICPVSERFPADKQLEITKQLDAMKLPHIPPRIRRPADENTPIQNTSLERHRGIEKAALGSKASGRRPSDHKNQLDIQFAQVLSRPATITLSSGSTGHPKAIVHSLAAHVASAKGAAVNMPLIAGDRWLWSLPTHHVSGFSILIRCAVAGATIVGMDRADEVSVELLRDSGVTHLSVVGTQLRRLMADCSFPQDSLKAVLLGGSAVAPLLIEQARARGVRVHTTYGLTETASQVTTSSASCDPRTAGCVLPYRELKIDGSGEILVRGDTLCLGYFQGGHIAPVVDDDGWFHTRDRGALDEKGRLTVLGRIDNMFISGGENIYPEAIEVALLELPGVGQAIVVPQSDEEFGERPVAFVQANLQEPSVWREQLRLVLRGFEIPVAFLEWPADGELAIKPNRTTLREIANQVL